MSIPAPERESVMTRNLVFLRPMKEGFCVTTSTEAWTLNGGAATEGRPYKSGRIF